MEEAIDNGSRTPKEKFDEEMKDINETINVKNAAEKEADWTDEEVKEHDEEVEELDKMVDEQVKEEDQPGAETLDKNMGTVQPFPRRPLSCHLMIQLIHKRIILALRTNS